MMAWWQVALTAMLTALATLGSAVLVYKQTVRGKQIETQATVSKAQIDNAIDERARLYGRVQFLEERYETLLMKVGAMNVQIAALQEETDKQRDELRQYKEANEGLAREKAELTKEVVALSKRRNDLETELSAAASHIHVLEAENKHLRGIGRDAPHGTER